MNRTLLVLLVLGAAASARAENATTPIPSPVGDGRPAAFGVAKYAGLEAEARMEAALHPSGDAPGAGSRLYVGNAAATFDLKQFSISVDGAAPVSVSLADEEAYSLAGTSELLWLKDISLAQGPHDIHVEMRANDLSKPDLGTQQIALDRHFELEAGGFPLEFKLVPAALLSSANIELVQHRNDGGHRSWLTRTVRSIEGLGAAEAYYSPGRSNDPSIRYVKHLLRVGQGDAAVVELLDISQSTADADSLPAEFWLKVSAALRMANLPDQARAVCDRLDAQKLEREAVGVERLRIGILHYNSGEVAKAEAQLLSAQGRLPEYRIQDWQVAYAQILFGRNQYAAARVVLQSGNVDSVDAYRYMNDSVEAVRTSAYRRFNLAVAMVHSGDEVKGLSLLDLVGRLKGSDGDLLALRDKANLTLGWHFLEAKQGTSAMGILGRVRSEGRYSSTALLGMGWAQLAPAGEKLARVRLSDDTDTRAVESLPAPLKNSLTQLGVLEPEMRGEVGPKSFTQDSPPLDRQDGLRRALQFWNILAGRDTRDPSVQEGLLAVAYAFDDLYDNTSARGAYSRAIAALEAQKKDLAVRSDFIHEAGFVEAIGGADGDAGLTLAMDRLHLTPGDSTRPLYASVDRYRDLGRLEQRLNDEQAAVASSASANSASTLPDLPSLLAALDSARQAEADNIRFLAQAELDQQFQSVDAYLKAAYFAAARATDETLGSAK
ncbi:MAG: hypothetical protein JWR07_3278 [Nevskia sp.]|nr:hypothetical protein [Nevskia sp.]